MMPTHRTVLTGHQRATLSSLADRLIPRSGRMPSASDVDIGGRLVDLVLRAREDLAGELTRVLDWSASLDPDEALSQLRQSDRPGFDVVCFVVTGGYFMDVSVKELIGYPGQESTPIDPYGYVEWVSSGLLDPVVERGPIYRPTPQSRLPR